jgi:membrane-bound serine protease (ClpP class)
MRGINKAIINSPLPIIAYVYPSGARAASAGLFIMYASHLAAMASGTNAGAASPVSLFGMPKQTDATQQSSEEKKVMNDAAAYIRSLAELRGRNANWGELAVRQAASVSANEAKQLKVIDEIADDYPQLLQKIDGHTVNIHGVSEKIKGKNVQLERIAPDWRYQFLAFITNPNIAYMLMLIAIYGLFFELSNPGLVVPGVVGVIALLIVLYAFQLMPINYTGLALVVFGIACMIFEVVVSSFGIIGIGGIIAFIIGSVMLFDIHDEYYRITWSLIVVMSAISILFFSIVIHLAIKSYKKAVVTGQEGLIGSDGIVLSVMNEKMVVRVLGEIWDATSTHSLKPGDSIKVAKVQGLVLTVEPSTYHEQKKLGD